MQHALSCPNGGFPILQHNEVQDLTANLMAGVCHNVFTELHLQLVTGEALSGTSAITAGDAQLDVAASGFRAAGSNMPSSVFVSSILMLRRTFHSPPVIAKECQGTSL